MENQLIGLEFSQNDEELLNAIKTQFPQCLLKKTQEFEGSEFFWMAIVPAAGTAIALGDFLLTHVIPKKTSNDNRPKSTNEKKRKICFNGEAVFATELAGKTKKEVAKILSTKLKVKLDFEAEVEEKNEP